eukprot:3437255-Pleurochrysis_carterae.AAC.1
MNAYRSRNGRRCWPAEHESSDILPRVPIVLPISAERSMTMTGMPIDWAQLWSKLAGRFPRPHQQHEMTVASRTKAASESCVGDISQIVRTGA